MANISLDGDLTTFLGAFVDSFVGGIARGVGTSISSSSGAPYASSLRGFGLFHPQDEDRFLDGTVTGIKLAEIRIDLNDLSRPAQVVDLLEIDGIYMAADSLFTFVARTPTTISGRFEPDVFSGLMQNNDFAVTGSENADSASPNDWIRFSGNDSFSMGRGNDKVDAADGNDKVLGGGGADLLYGGRGKDKIAGQSGKDTLRGDAGNDALRGGGGADKLFGNGGNDRLNGESGRDILTGGNGNDTFVYSGNGRDVIRDFETGADTLNLDGSLWNGKLSVREVVDDFGKLTKSGIRLDFGDDDVIRLNGLDNLLELADDILIF